MIKAFKDKFVDTYFKFVIMPIFIIIVILTASFITSVYTKNEIFSPLFAYISIIALLVIYFALQLKGKK